MEMTNTYARLMQVSPGEVVEVSEDFVSRGEKNYEGIQVKIYTVQSEAATNPHIV